MGQRGDARRFLVVAVDHLPRRPARVGLPEHLVHRGQIVGPLRAVAIILGSRLPALPRIVEPVGKTYVLFRLRDVNEQLDQIGPATGQLRLILVDLVIALAPLGLACESLDPLDEHAAVPAAVKDRNFARSRQPLPEAPEESSEEHTSELQSLMRTPYAVC